MIEPNENIFKYIQLKHVSGIISGIVSAFSRYIDPQLVRDALLIVYNEKHIWNTLKMIYENSEEYRTDYEKDGEGH
jgi:isochorismate hydrolase